MQAPEPLTAEERMRHISKPPQWQRDATSVVLVILGVGILIRSLYVNVDPIEITFAMMCIILAGAPWDA